MHKTRFLLFVYPVNESQCNKNKYNIKIKSCQFSFFFFSIAENKNSTNSFSVIIPILFEKAFPKLKQVVIPYGFSYLLHKPY